jgi:hypothetical protein
MQKALKFTLVVLISLIFQNIALSQSAAEKEVASAVEKLKDLMVTPDKAQLEKLVSDKLSYGHSGGTIENKAQFVDAFVSGKSDFLDITLSDQTITVSDNTAIVRHKLAANTNDPGKGPAKVNLHILTVWQKQGGSWKLLARQAVKIPVQ